MKVKAGRQKPSVTALPSPGGASFPVAGLQMVSVKPTPRGPFNNSLPGTNEDALREIKSSLDELLEIQGPKSKIARGTFMKLPKHPNLSPGVDLDPPAPVVDAVADATRQNDLPAIHFVNFLEDLQGSSFKNQQAQMDMIKTWRAWASVICEVKVDNQVQSGRLPISSDERNTRGSYRAEVFDYLFRYADWSDRTLNQNKPIHIGAEKTEFHYEILKMALEGYEIPPTSFPMLVKTLQTISQRIMKSNPTESEYEPLTNNVNINIHILQFGVDQEGRNYLANKTAYESVSCDINYNLSQADFNSEVFSKVQQQLDPSGIDEGKQLAGRATTTIIISREG
ncbi:Fc.00g000850.m01.CDS01 [Cosmosporella sp. VM-42]